MACFFGQACFAAGTPLRTPGGSAPVEALQVGDVVLAQDEDDPHGPIEAKAVEGTRMRPTVPGFVVFHSPTEHQASVAIHGQWERPPVDLVLQARANGGYGNDPHDSCAEFLAWLLGRCPRLGSFCVVSVPGVEWGEQEDE